MAGFVVHDVNAPEGNRISYHDDGYAPSPSSILAHKIVFADDKDKRFRYYLKECGPKGTHITNPAFPFLKSFVVLASPENVRTLRDFFKTIGAKKTVRELEKKCPWAFAGEPKGIRRFFR